MKNLRIEPIFNFHYSHTGYATPNCKGMSIVVTGKAYFLLPLKLAGPVF